jgi:hypothetical protein
MRYTKEHIVPGFKLLNSNNVEIEILEMAGDNIVRWKGTTWGESYSAHIDQIVELLNQNVYKAITVVIEETYEIY